MHAHRTLMLLGLVGCTEFDLKEIPEAEAGATGILEADPGALRFGELPDGEPTTQTFAVTSVGTGPVTLREAYIDNASAPFSMVWTHSGTTLAPGDVVGVTVTYTPSSLDDSAEVIILSDAVEEELHVPLSGSILSAALSVVPSPAEFISAEGEPVTRTLNLNSVGTAPLELYEQLTLGPGFTVVSSPIPVTLEPGESAPLTVLYTPTSDEDRSEGELWLGSNAVSSPTLVSLQGMVEPPCLGLGEAWDKGVLDIYSATGSSITLSNMDTDSHDICVDRWYIYLGVQTQDAGAGDPFYDPGAEYPLGTLTLAPGESVRFDYTQPDDPAWWCVEQTQVTNTSYDFIYIGAAVPEPMLELMLSGVEARSTEAEAVQNQIWAWETNNPVIVVGRNTHYADLSAKTPSSDVEIVTINMGSQPGAAEIEETIPAGFMATGFSPSPVRAALNKDGSTTYTFVLDYEARITTDLNVHTIYDEHSITYTLWADMETCQGRHQIRQPTATWADSSGTIQVTEGSPLVVRCY